MLVNCRVTIDISTRIAGVSIPAELYQFTRIVMTGMNWSFLLQNILLCIISLDDYLFLLNINVCIHLYIYQLNHIFDTVILIR